MPTATSTLAARLKDQARRVGFEPAGIARLRESDHAAFYRAWLDDGRHGNMRYLARPDAVERRTDPRQAWPDLRSALVVAHNYYQEDDDGAPDDPSRAVIARYARGRDYHKVVKKKLLKLLRWLEDETGRELPVARAYVDTGPVLERELARRAGLGWFGRNTMLIDPGRGSYLFLGTLLLPFELEADEPFEEDRCGSCSNCLDACPTGALLGRDEDGAPVMEARRCISYLTIEHRGPIPRELRPLMGNRVYGCDICQEVCPWNGEKFVEVTAEADYTDYPVGGPGKGKGEGEGKGAADADGGGSGSGVPGTDGPELIELMGMGDEAWDTFSRGRAIRRAKRAGFLRNVAVGLGNWGSRAAVPVLVAALEDEELLVRGHAAWALGRIGGGEATRALGERLAVEGDGWVREELEGAFES